MKTNYVLYSVLLSTLFFFNNSSNADSLVVNLPDGTTWTGELGQSVHVEYNVNDKISKRDGTLRKVATRYIYVDTHAISIKNIILIQNSETTTGESPPTADPSLGSSSEVSNDAVDTAAYRWVVARGAGITSDEAKKDAWRNAIERVAGVYITANSQIENGQLLKDTITAHSNAYIEEFKLIDEDIKGGIVRVQIRAKVATKMLFEKLKSMGGELEFRSVDGESKYAKIVTQNQQTKSAIETLPAAMEGYPEALIDIEIGETRMAMKGVFNDGKEHLIVPLTFSWNNNAWATFTYNLNQYLKHVSSDSNSFKLRLQGLKTVSSSNNRGQVEEVIIDKNSWFRVGWERAWLKNGKLPWIGRFSFDYKLKGIYDGRTVWEQVINSYRHDYILDVVVILDNNLKNGTSYAVSRDIWDSLRRRMKQTTAFYMNAISKIDGVELGQPDSGSELVHSVFRTPRNACWISSLPRFTGMREPWNLPNSVTDINDLDRSDEENSPRVMLILPFFSADFDEYRFNRNSWFYLSEFSYDYSINLELEEVDDVAKVEIETYVLDLHNKRRRDNEGHRKPIIQQQPTPHRGTTRGQQQGPGRRKR